MTDNANFAAGGMTVGGSEITVEEIDGGGGYMRLTIDGNSYVLDDWTAAHIGQGLAGIRAQTKERLLPHLGEGFTNVVAFDVANMQNAASARAVSEDQLREELMGEHPPAMVLDHDTGQGVE